MEGLFSASVQSEVKSTAYGAKATFVFWTPVLSRSWLLCRPPSCSGVAGSSWLRPRNENCQNALGLLRATKAAESSHKEPHKSHNTLRQSANPVEALRCSFKMLSTVMISVITSWSFHRCTVKTVYCLPHATGGSQGAWSVTPRKPACFVSANSLVYLLFVERNTMHGTTMNTTCRFFAIVAVSHEKEKKKKARKQNKERQESKQEDQDPERKFWLKLHRERNPFNTW